MNFRVTCYVSVTYLQEISQIPREEIWKKKPIAIAECPEEIPCNICANACPSNAIKVEGLRGKPKIDWDKCTGCSVCVGVCPGLAMFVIREKDDKGYVTLPYEFLPKLKKDDRVILLNRIGEKVGYGTVKKVYEYNKTQVVTVETPKNLIMEVRAVWKA